MVVALDELRPYQRNAAHDAMALRQRTIQRDTRAKDVVFIEGIH